MSVRLFASTTESNEHVEQCALCERVLLPGQASAMCEEMLEYLCGHCLPHVIWVENELERLVAVTQVRMPTECEAWELFTK